MDYRAAYDRVLPNVTNPAQYVGGEWNSVAKPPEGVDLRVCLTFPDTYAIGMSHTGLQILYSTLNRRPDVAAERAFAPWSDMEAQLRAQGLPLVSLETARPLKEFDVLGFSLQYEMAYTNVLNMLDLGGVPLAAAERSVDDPIVLAGGPCTLHPEPMADFVDVFFLGEAEEGIHAFLDCLRAVRAEGGHADRPALLTALADAAEKAGLDFLYFPEVPQPGRTATYVADLEAAHYPVTPIVPYIDIIHDRITVEIMRGCPHRCRFCEAGHTRGRARRRSVERIIDIAEQTYRNTGINEIGLVSLSSGDYPALPELLKELNDRFDERAVNISLPSLRVDDSLVKLPQYLNTVRKSALTLAPEAGTERLRKVIGKDITDEALFNGVESACREGWRHVKLYFMIGLPTETDEDLDGIARIVEQVVAIGKRAGQGLRVNLSVSPFVPKPHTPFQWEAMDTLEVLREKRARLGEAVRARSVTFKSHRVERSIVEAVMARGDRSLGRAIRAAWEAGARFDAWDEHFTLERWQAAFDAAGIDPHPVAHEPFALDAPLPWDHIGCLTSKEQLLASREAVM